VVSIALLTCCCVSVEQKAFQPALAQGFAFYIRLFFGRRSINGVSDGK
jgi:hypothetical protein